MTELPLPVPGFASFRKRNSLTLGVYSQEANAGCVRPEHSVLSEFSSSRETCLVLGPRGNSWSRTDVHLRNFCTPAATARPRQSHPTAGPGAAKGSVGTCPWLRGNREWSVTKASTMGGRNLAGRRKEAQADGQLLTPEPQDKAHLEACSSSLSYMPPVVCQTRRPRVRARECVLPGLTPSASSTEKSQQQSK